MLTSETILPICDSTNDVARELAANGAPHGSWISAQKQRQGRGRLGREWISEEGNLYLSIILRPNSNAVLSWFPIAVAVGACRAIEALQPHAQLNLKWPNDIWSGGKKAGGILCEGASNSHGPTVIAGIGLNCKHAPPGVGATALHLSADDLRPRVVQEVLAVIQKLEAQGPAEIKAEYDHRALFKSGSQVTWSSGKPGMPAGQDSQDAHEGEVVGLGPHGELLVYDQTGHDTSAGRDRLISLYAEDVKIRGLPEAIEKFPA